MLDEELDEYLLTNGAAREFNNIKRTTASDQYHDGSQLGAENDNEYLATDDAQQGELMEDDEYMVEIDEELSIPLDVFSSLLAEGVG